MSNRATIILFEKVSTRRGWWYWFQIGEAFVFQVTSCAIGFMTNKHMLGFNYKTGVFYV